MIIIGSFAQLAQTIQSIPSVLHTSGSQMIIPDHRFGLYETL